MKYDLKAMDFSPDAEFLSGAFLWYETPEGYDYWGCQYTNGLTPEGQAKWDAMKQQWNEENGVGEREVGTLAELGVKAGDVVMGTYVGSEKTYTKAVKEIKNGKVFYQGGSFDSLNGGSHFRIISRATPQRYVVLTDDEPVICTRDEAEELCLGGVDAVYELGDKVEVSVKVEFE